MKSQTPNCETIFQTEQPDEPAHLGRPWTRRYVVAHEAFRFAEPVTVEPTEGPPIHQLSVIIANRLEQVLRLNRLEDQVAELSARVEHLTGQVKTVCIHTFEPEPYEILRPVPIVVEPSGEEFSASFFDANISTSGETEQEAFDNIKNLILDIYDSLTREASDRLGPEPQRQLAVLRSFVRGA
jgi:predicted RNase H-like HicB family nuclease